MSQLITTLTGTDLGGLIIKETQDCDPIAEICKNLQTAGKTGSSDLRFAGTIPDVMVEKYCIDNGVTFRDFCINPEHVKRVMNDPAMAHFRVWKGLI